MKDLKRVNLVLGKTGTGKSYFIKNYLIPSLFNSNHNIIIFDVMNEYDNKYFLICYDYESFLETLKKDIENIRIIIKTSNLTEIVLIQNFIYNYLKNIYLILEECRIYLNDTIENYINFGRHKNINLIMVARRGVELKNKILSLVEKVFIFRTTSDYDTLYYKRVFGINERSIEKIKTLNIGTYLEYEI